MINYNTTLTTNNHTHSIIDNSYVNITDYGSDYYYPNIGQYSYHDHREIPISRAEFYALQTEMEEKMKKFLNFLELKGIVEKGEYREFLDSLDVIEKMSKE